MRAARKGPRILSILNVLRIRLRKRPCYDPAPTRVHQSHGSVPVGSVAGLIVDIHSIIHGPLGTDLTRTFLRAAIVVTRHKVAGRHISPNSSRFAVAARRASNHVDLSPRSANGQTGWTAVLPPGQPARFSSRP